MKPLVAQGLGQTSNSHDGRKINGLSAPELTDIRHATFRVHDMYQARLNDNILATGPGTLRVHHPVSRVATWARMPILVMTTRCAAVAVSGTGETVNSNRMSGAPRAAGPSWHSATRRSSGIEEHVDEIRNAWATHFPG